MKCRTATVGMRGLRTVSRLVAFGIGVGAAVPAVAGDWVQFSDQTPSRIRADAGLVVGDSAEKSYTWGDLDGDGDIDLVVVRATPFGGTAGKRNVLLMNEGGILVDRTLHYAVSADDGGQGFLDLTADRGVVLVDVNNDGWLDVVTAVGVMEGLPKSVSHPRVYVNLGGDGEGNWLGLHYVESLIPQLNPVGAPQFESVAAGDVTNDGFTDLYFTDSDLVNPQTYDFNNRLLINCGTADPGRFKDETRDRMTIPMWQSGFSAGAAVVDVNHDGALDILKHNAPFHVAVTYNDPDNVGYFKAHKPVYDFAPYFVSAGDLNNDGWVDMVISDDGVDAYLLNQGNPNSNGEVSWKTKFLPGQTDGFGGIARIVDLNKDGWEDIFITDIDVSIPGCTRVSDILRNNGDAPEVTFSHDPGNLTDLELKGVFDVAIFDVDGDGWPDMVVGRCSETRLFLNVPPTGVEIMHDEVPSMIPPNHPYALALTVSPVEKLIAPPVRHVSIDSGSWSQATMISWGGGVFASVLPAAPCGSRIRWYYTVELITGEIISEPALGPVGAFHADVRSGLLLLRDDTFESGEEAEWTVQNDPSLTGGAWELADPNGTIAPSSYMAAPDEDHTPGPGNVLCFVTENGAPGAPAHLSDVDGGPTILISPVLDYANADGFVEFAYWFFSESGITDELFVDLSNDDGATWHWAETLVTAAGVGWRKAQIRVSDVLPPTAQVRVRFRVADEGAPSLTEAAVDDFRATKMVCDAQIIDSQPPSGSIDARQPSDPGGSIAMGWNVVNLTFDGDVLFAEPEHFVIEQHAVTGGVGTCTGAAPLIGSVLDGGVTQTLNLSHPICAGGWTKIRHVPSGTWVTLGYLPGDVNSDALSSVADVLSLLNHLNGVVNLPVWSSDIDRNGAAGPSDVLRAIDLLNGAGAYDPWNLVALP